MSRNGTSADALIEILALCETTLAALDQQPETNAPALPAKALVTTRRQRAKSGRPFSLIKGGLYQPHHEPEAI